jgi:hypothetical protein
MTRLAFSVYRSNILPFPLTFLAEKNFLPDPTEPETHFFTDLSVDLRFYIMQSKARNPKRRNGGVNL